MSKVVNFGPIIPRDLGSVGVTVDKNWNFKNITPEMIPFLKKEVILTKVNNPGFTHVQVAEAVVKKLKIIREE